MCIGGKKGYILRNTAAFVDHVFFFFKLYRERCERVKEREIMNHMYMSI